MVPKFLTLVVYTLQFAGVLTASVSSCGGPHDHLSDVQIKLTPDPIQKGRSFSLEASGTLDEELTNGSVKVDLDVQALRVIDDKVSKSSPFSISPGIAKGPQRLVIGPVTLPEVPGSAHVSGKVQLANKAGEPVACIALDLNMPALESDMAGATQAKVTEEPRLHEVSNCGQPSDHMQGLKTENSGGVESITGTLDEELTKLSIDYDLTAKVGFINVPLKMTVPISYSPGIPKGPIAMSFGPAKAADDSALLWPKPKVEVSGTMKINDDKNEEVACVAVGDKLVSAEAPRDVVV